MVIFHIRAKPLVKVGETGVSTQNCLRQVTDNFLTSIEPDLRLDSVEIRLGVVDVVKCSEA